MNDANIVYIIQVVSRGIGGITTKQHTMTGVSAGGVASVHITCTLSSRMPPRSKPSSGSSAAVD